jgi:DNA-binding NarL/FixJ family response regulator
MIKIVVVGEAEQDRSRVHSLLSVQEDFEIAGFGKDGYDALKLAAQFQPDIIIIDLWKDIIDGPGLIPLVRRKSPSTTAILLCNQDDDESACRALTAGAFGFLVKKTDMDKLAAAVRTVLQGGHFISPKIVTRTFSMLSELTRYRNICRSFLPPKSGYKPIPPIPSNISRKELEIMSFIGKGHTNKEIAETLKLKPGTVRNYLSAAMRKAGLQSRTQVAIYALRNGLIDPEEL